LSGLNGVKSALLRYNPDLEIVNFHRIGEVKILQFLYHERKSLNLDHKFIPFFKQNINSDE